MIFSRISSSSHLISALTQNITENGKLPLQEFYDKVQQASRKLLQMGVKHGDKVALISTNNRTEWCIMDQAVLQLEPLPFPSPTITGPEYEYVLTHSESRFCFISDAEIFEKLTKVAKNTMLEGIYSFEEVKGCDSWNMLFENDDPIYKTRSRKLKKRFYQKI